MKVGWVQFYVPLLVVGAVYVSIFFSPFTLLLFSFFFSFFNHESEPGLGSATKYNLLKCAAKPARVWCYGRGESTPASEGLNIFRKLPLFP